MSSKSMQCTTSICSLLVILLHFFSSSLARDSQTSTHDSVCGSTPFPSFCKSLLPNNNNSATIYDHCRFSAQRSLDDTTNLLALIYQYLKSPHALSLSTVRALQDCQLLIGRNHDFLSTTIQTIDSTDTLNSSQADDTHTFLSAVLTNQQTCSDGLIQSSVSSSDSSVANTLSTKLSDTSMVYSVSLALFKNGWAHDHETRRNSHGRRQTRQAFLNFDIRGRIYESAVRGRKLLQSSGGTVIVNYIVTVSQDGTGDFPNITAAVAAAPTNSKASTGYYLIYVKAGVYQEYITIASNQRYVMMIGDGINQTVITGNHSVGGGWTTFSSATLAVNAVGFVAINITIQNTAGAANYQAVALRSSGDLSAFYSCSFEGYQDTLYTHSMRQFYTQCDIYGTVDFIFGNAAVVLQDCNIYARLPLHGQFNTITAQGKTDINQNTGTSILNCSIRAAPDLASSNSATQTYLGRPWKLYSTTVYIQSFMDSLINPAGWSVWSGSFALNTSFYAVYNNSGPGSNTSNYVSWSYVINATEADNFYVSNFIQGDSWLPATGVPYTGGLI